MDYILAILHENTVKIKFNLSLSYKQGRMQDFIEEGTRIFKIFVDFF